MEAALTVGVFIEIINGNEVNLFWLISDPNRTH